MELRMRGAIPPAPAHLNVVLPSTKTTLLSLTEMVTYLTVIFRKSLGMNDENYEKPAGPAEIQT
jgi:hypothetical protein